MYCPGTSVQDAGERTGVEEEELFSSFEGVYTADAVSFVFDGVVDSFVDFDFDINGLVQLIKNKLTLVTLRYKGQWCRQCTRVKVSRENISEFI